MTFDELTNNVLKILPNATVCELSSGELVIYTNLERADIGDEVIDIGS